MTDCGDGSMSMLVERVRWRWSRATGAAARLEAIDQVLETAAAGAVLILNFPSNPIGYSPTLAEAQALVERIASHPRPLVVVTDDAYQGMVWEPQQFL